MLGQVQTAARNNGRSDFVSLVVQSFVAPPARQISIALTTTGEFLEGVRDANMLRRQNERLTAELEGMKQYQETMDRLRAHVDSLRSMNDYVPPPSRTKVFANIIGYAPDQNSMVIDRGTNDGIKKNQPVIGAKGLVGIIDIADRTRSHVLLITSPAIRIAASISGNPSVPGIVQGETSSRLAMSVYESNDVQVGAPVETSGFSYWIPQGIRIGIVIEAVDDPQFGTKRVFVLPYVQMGELNEVFVLK